MTAEIAARISCRAPLRVSFFGGGSDFPEIFEHQRGAVLSTAVDLSTHVWLKPTPPSLFEHPFRLFFGAPELRLDVESIENALSRELLRAHPRPWIEIHSAGDVPQGSGLGSSSSFSVALLKGLHALQGRSPDPMDLAYEAIELERRATDNGVGCQDQVMAAVGGFRRIEMRRLDDIDTEPVPIGADRLRELESQLVLTYIGAPRSAADLERRKLKKVRRNADTLRAMVQQVDEAFNLLAGTASLAPFGEALHRSWTAKRSLASGVSNPEIDGLYESCRTAGALGGKLLGAGGAGFLMLFVPPERLDSVVAVIRNTGRTVLRPRLGCDGVRSWADPPTKTPPQSQGGHGR